jgi:alpha-beta hydrolase superfamily lysophospholipase
MEHFEGTFNGDGGVALYYQGWRPDGTPRAALAVVHGFGEHSGRYGNVVDRLVPQGYAVYGFDLRGHGRSPGQRGFIESFAQLRADIHGFLALVRAEEPGHPVFLLGHSQGGLDVLDYVLHHPDGLAGVIASGPVLCPPGISAFLIRLSKLLSKIWPRFSLEVGLDVDALSRDRAVVDAYVNDPLVHGKGTPRLGAEVAAATEWTQAHAADMALPLLIVHGGADRICPAEASREFFEKVPSADKERHEYEGYYHEIFNDVGKEQVLADVEAWLERHLESTGELK